MTDRKEYTYRDEALGIDRHVLLTDKDAKDIEGLKQVTPKNKASKPGENKQVSPENEK